MFLTYLLREVFLFYNIFSDYQETSGEGPIVKTLLVFTEKFLHQVYRFLC